MANWTTREIRAKAPGAERVSILSRVSSISSWVSPTKALFSTVDSICSWGSDTWSGMRISLFFTTLLSVITTAMKAFSLHHQQVVPLHRHPLFGGGGGKDGVVADLGENLARPVDDPVQLLHLHVQRVVDALGLLHGSAGARP